MNIFILIFLFCPLTSFAGVKEDEQLYNGVVTGRSNLVRDALNSGANPNSVQIPKALTQEYQEQDERSSGNPDMEDVRNAMHSWTPLMRAAATGNTKIVKMLIKAGASVHARTQYGDTPLHVAISDKIVETLLKNGANINGTDRNGDTLLHKTASDGNIARAKMLIRYGANVNAKNHNDETPLHSAAINVETAVAKLLVANGANPNLKAQGETPLDKTRYLSFKEGHSDHVSFFRDQAPRIYSKFHLAPSALWRINKRMEESPLGERCENGVPKYLNEPRVVTDPIASLLFEGMDWSVAKKLINDQDEIRNRMRSRKLCPPAQAVANSTHKPSLGDSGSTSSLSSYEGSKTPNSSRAN